MWKTAMATATTQENIRNIPPTSRRREQAWGSRPSGWEGIQV
jgi:hypothetical protein